MNFSKNTFQFFRAYLQDRYQYVSYKGYESKRFYCPSGIPQGSNLRPLLFTIFINDVADSITSFQVLLYADDIKLHRSVQTEEEASLLQRDLDTLILSLE